MPIITVNSSTVDLRRVNYTPCNRTLLKEYKKNTNKNCNETYTVFIIKKQANYVFDLLQLEFPEYKFTICIDKKIKHLPGESRKLMDRLMLLLENTI